jgi:alpha-L-fucosidase
VFVLNPVKGEIELPSLGFESAYGPKKIKSIKMLGSKEEVNFKQTDDKLKLFVPANRPSKYTAVFEVHGAL